jgi:hypothetical protein
MVLLPEGTQLAGRQYSNVPQPVAMAKDRTKGSSTSGPDGRLAIAGDQTGYEIDPATAPGAKDTNASRRSPASRTARSSLAAGLAATLPMGSINSQEAQALAETKTPVQVDYAELTVPVAVAASQSSPSILENGLAWAAGFAPVPPLGPGETVSMFPSDNDLMAAIDPALLPPNIGPVTIWVEDAYGNQIIVGTVNPGVNPMVVIIRNAYLGGGGLYTVTASGTNVLGHFP